MMRMNDENLCQLIRSLSFISSRNRQRGKSVVMFGGMGNCIVGGVPAKIITKN